MKSHRVGKVEQRGNELVNLELGDEVEHAVGRHIHCAPSRNNKGPERQNVSEELMPTFGGTGNIDLEEQNLNLN